MNHNRFVNQRNRAGANFLFVLALMLAFYAVPLPAQNKQQTDLLEDKALQKMNIPSMPVSAPALEGPIDADKYVVGPSDVLGVNIWTSPPLSFVLSVTPEGTVIVPTVGEVKVSDLKLSLAKERVLAEIRKKYLSGNSSVTLLSPRDIVVTVTGSVRYPGRYVMNAAQRVDRLIQEANKIAVRSQDKIVGQSVQIEENPNYNPVTASKRSIVLRRRDGTTHHVDIQEFFATKNEQRDPFLLEGDEVFVPRTDDAKNLIAVYGAVNAPGRFEFVLGDSMLGAIKLAYGFTNRADPDSVELMRINSSNGTLNPTIIKVRDLLPGSLQNLPLEPGDRILVKEKFDLRQDYRVYIEGEVRFPGIYPITKGQTRLSQAIREAGGFTEFASLQSAELLRNSVNVDEGQLSRMLRQRGNITPEDNAYVTVEGDIQVRRDNVNVDFEKLFQAKDSTQDILVQAEDRIVIPSTRRTVHVFGQVVTSGNVPFVAGKDVQYYIAQSGGYTDDAEKGDVAVIKWSTRQWFEPGKIQIEEGDYIWVPPVVRRPASYWLAVIGQTTSIISVALSIVILVVQLKK
jgi:protein involved in polysaccharide export with SLBB domain